MKTVDVIIIGAGTAGMSAAAALKKFTDNFVIINAGSYGTTCAEHGCMPTNTLLTLARELKRAKRLAATGVICDVSVTSFASAQTHIRNLRDRFVRSVETDFEKNWQRYSVSGFAQFEDFNKVTVEGETYEATRGIIVATGAKPSLPHFVEPVQEFVLTSEQLYTLDDLPQSILVVGCDTMAMEIAFALSTFERKVALLGPTPPLCRLDDPVIHREAIERFQKEFPIYFSDDMCLERSPRGVTLRINDKKPLYDFEACLLFTQRIPNIKKLGLETLGIELEGDSLSALQLKALEERKIFFAGDSAGLLHLHEALSTGIQCVENLFYGDTRVNKSPFLHVAETDPALVVCGLSYADAVVTGRAEVKSVKLSDLGRAIIEDEEEGDIHIYVDKDDEKILGAQLIAPGGEHLAQYLLTCIELGITLKEASKLTFRHPSLEECLRLAS